MRAITALRLLAFRLGLLNITRRDGLRLLIEPLTYWRSVELPATIEALAPWKGARVLDVGSPKLASMRLAVSGCEVWATDLFDYFVSDYGRYAGQLAVGDRYHIETQDGRSLRYADHFFDLAYAISVLEHIPGDGDSRAISEMARVASRIVLTVPVAPSYYESFTKSDLYYKTAGEFYERHYDERALQERLIGPSGLTVERLTLYGERFGWDRWCRSKPKPLRYALSLFSGIAAAASIRTTQDFRHAQTALVVLGPKHRPNG